MANRKFEESLTNCVPQKLYKLTYDIASDLMLTWRKNPKLIQPRLQISTNHFLK
jgi:hypothetical protein